MKLISPFSGTGRRWSTEGRVKAYRWIGRMSTMPLGPRRSFVVVFLCVFFGWEKEAVVALLCCFALHFMGNLLWYVVILGRLLAASRALVDFVLIFRRFMELVPGLFYVFWGRSACVVSLWSVLKSESGCNKPCFFGIHQTFLLGVGFFSGLHLSFSTSFENLQGAPPAKRP